MSSVFLSSLAGSIAAMLKLVGVMSVGAGSAHFGYLNPTFIPYLSAFTFMFITACQVISNLCREFSIEKLERYWPLLVWGAYSILWGYAVGFIYCAIFKPPREYVTSIVSSIAYANTIGLPIVIFDSLAVSLYTTPTRTSLEAFQEAVALTFVFSVPWNLLMYIVGYPYVLELKMNESDDDTTTNDSSRAIEGDETNSNNNELTQLSDLNALSSQGNHIIDSDDDGDGSLLTNNIDSSLDTKYAHKTPSPYYNNDNFKLLDEDKLVPSESTISKRNTKKNDINQQTITYYHDDNTYLTSTTDQPTPLHPLDIDIDDDPNYPPATIMQACGKISYYFNNGCQFLGIWLNYLILSRLKRSHTFTIKMVFTNPPTVATLLSLVIGVIPPIKDPFFEPTGTFHFFIKAIDFLALVSAPISNLVTSANIYHSIHRNFGPKARELQRIIDLVNEAQLEMNAEEEERQKNNNNNISNKDQYDINNSSITPVPIVTALSTLKKQNSILGASNNNSSNHNNQPNSVGIYPRDDNFLDDDVAADEIDTFPELPPPVITLTNIKPSSKRTTPTFNSRSTPTTIRPSSSSITSSPSSTNIVHHYQHKVQESPFLIPLHATSDLAINDENDLELFNRTYSYVPKQQIKSLSSLQSIDKAQLLPSSSKANLQGTQFINSDGPQSISLFGNDDTGNNTNNITPPMNKIDFIMSKVDPSLPIDYDPETGKIMPLPRLSWLQMLGVAICRLIIVPTIIYFTMLVIQWLDLEDIILPKSALYRSYIMLASCSVSADSILMMITKAFRIRQSMMLSLVYVVQYIICLVTIPLWLVLINTTNSQYNT